MLSVTYRYGRVPGLVEIRALAAARQVYGIWSISFDEPRHLLHLDYDASRLTEDDLAALVRNAGIDLLEKIPVESSRAA